MTVIERRPLQVLATRKAPMLLLDAQHLHARMSDGEALPTFGEMEEMLTPISRINPNLDRVVLVSHRWWRPGEERSLSGVCSL